MATFTCRIGTPTGKVLVEDREAETLDRLRQQLETEGYYIFQVRPRSPLASWSLSRPSVWWRRARKQDLLVFNQEFLALLRAGLPILTALDLVMERQTHPRLRQVLERVREAVKGGASLSEAAQQHPEIFSSLYVASVRVGEKSGDLPDTLARYIQNLKRMITLQKKVMSALLYPSILLVLTTAVVVFLLTVVVPAFSQLYLDFEAQLPYPTQVLLTTTGLVRDYLLVALPLPLLGLFGLWQWRRTSAGQLTLDRLLLRLPLLGQVLHQFSLAIFCRTLGTVLAGGMPMVPALEIAAGSVHNRAAAAQLHRAIPAVTGGTSVAAALERAKAAPPLVLEMVGVGERTGALEEMLQHVADFIEEELEQRLSSMTTLLEPVIMVAMGLVVAGIVITMYLPIFHLSSAVR
ncbi:MAG: type II secretion system F family protein [Candidatus Methylomirabilales bacterium]